MLGWSRLANISSIWYAFGYGRGITRNGDGSGFLIRYGIPVLQVREGVSGEHNSTPYTHVYTSTSAKVFESPHHQISFPPLSLPIRAVKCDIIWHLRLRICPAGHAIGWGHMSETGYQTRRICRRAFPIWHLGEDTRCIRDYSREDHARYILSVDCVG